MPSLIPNYEYDIFISYRHNDNRSGWVTDFVKALQEELAATIKETVSVYFDSNPHDGLLETHNVDKSLEGKLKCLIFIPILSQTYCDPKSFAWQHEFVAFNKLAKVDGLGRDIKLSNGNVASRILPIKIHDLDAEDKAIIENEIGGVLRAIDFIYKSGGVNRPLNSKDDEVRTPGKILYRDQVNKVANAIKEIVSSIKKPDQNHFIPTATNNQSQPSLRMSAPLKWVAVVLLVLAASFSIYYWLLKPEPTATEVKSIAILPFRNLSGDADQDYLGDGISEELLYTLSKIQGLRVIGRASAFSLKGETENSQAMLEKLGVSFVLDGSVRKDNDNVRISTRLIRTSDNLQLWSETYDRKMEGIFKLQDDIASSVVDALKVSLSPDERKEITKKATHSVEAYDLYLRGTYEYRKYSPDGNRNASKLYSEALALDSSYSYAYSGIAGTLLTSAAMFIAEREALDALELCKPYLDKALALDEANVEAHTWLGFYYLYHDWDFDKAELEYKKGILIDPKNSEANLIYADFLKFTLRHDEALSFSEQQLKYDYLNFNPRKGISLYYLNRFQEALEFQKARLGTINTYWTYDTYGFVCLNTARYDDAIDSFNKAMALIGRRVPRMIGWMGAAYAKQGKLNQSTKLLNELIEMRKSTNAGSVNFFTAAIYSAMGKEDEAIQWLERAYDDHDMEIPWLISEPQFNNLHDNPKFIGLARRVGFPESSLEKLKETPKP